MSRNINIEIAIELGFHSWFHQHPDDSQRGWKILDQKEGSAIGTMGHTTEQAAWAIFIAGRKWNSDLSKAWELMLLLPEFSAHLLCTRAIQKKWCHKDFAQEIAETFLAWKLSQKEKKDDTGNSISDAQE